MYGSYFTLRKVSPPLHFLRCWMKCVRKRNLGGLSELFSPPTKGEKKRGSEIMKGLLMAFFAIYGQVRTGFIARVTFRKGFLCFFSCADQIFIPCRHSFGTPSRKEGISFLFYDLFWTSMITSPVSFLVFPQTIIHFLLLFKKTTNPKVSLRGLLFFANIFPISEFSPTTSLIADL